MDHAPYPYVEERDEGSLISETIVHHDMGIGTSDSSLHLVRCTLVP